MQARVGTARTATGPAAAYDSGALTAPGVPLTTVVVQNTFGFPVQVVISAGTMTAVIVNGVTVGSGAGTYWIPKDGSISLTYTVAPTWTWARARSGWKLRVTGASRTTVVALETSPDNSTWTERDRVTGEGFAEAGVHVYARYARENIIGLGGQTTIMCSLISAN
jgi:hypothetical protein